MATARDMPRIHHVGMKHGTLANWMKAYVDGLPTELLGPDTLVGVITSEEWHLDWV